MTIEKSKIRTITGKKAQAMVEFAIAVPIVMVLVLGVFEFGRLIFVYTSITSASREAARYGAGVGSTDSGTILYQDCSGIRDAAIRIGRFAGVKTSDVHIFHDSGPDTSLIEYCKTPSDLVDFQQDDRISVKVDVEYDPVVPLVNIPSFILHSQSAHTILLGADVVAVQQPSNAGGGQICDVTPYLITVTNPLGPVVSATIENTSGSDVIINNLLIVWDTTSSPVLQSMSGIPGIAYPPPSPANLGPAYSTSLGWVFPNSTEDDFKAANIFIYIFKSAQEQPHHPAYDGSWRQNMRIRTIGDKYETNKLTQRKRAKPG